MIKNVFLILAMSFCGVYAHSAGGPVFLTEQFGPGATPQTRSNVNNSAEQPTDENSDGTEAFKQAGALNDALEAQEAECKAAIEKVEAAKQNCLSTISSARVKCDRRKSLMEKKQKEGLSTLTSDFTSKLSGDAGSIGAVEACNNLKKANQDLSDKSAKSYADYCSRGDSACEKGDKDCSPSEGYEGCSKTCNDYRNQVQSAGANACAASEESQKAWSEAIEEMNAMVDGDSSCQKLSEKVQKQRQELKDSFDTTNAANEEQVCKKQREAGGDGPTQPPEGGGPIAKPSGGGGSGGGGDTGGGSGGGQQNAEQKKSGGGDPFSQLLSGLMGMMNQQGGGDTSGQVATAVDPCNGDALCKCMMMGGDARSCSQNSQQAPTVTAFSNPLANVGGAKMTNGTVDDTPPAIPNGQMQLPEFKNQEQPGGQPGAGMYTGGGGGMGGGSGNFKPDPPAGKARSSLSADILSGTQKGGSSAGAASLNSRSFSSSSPREPSSSDRPENKPITPDLKQFMPTIQPNDLKVSGMEPTSAKDGRLGQDFVSYCISISQCGSSDSNLWGNSRRAVDTLREKYSDNFED